MNMTYFLLDIEKTQSMVCLKQTALCGGLQGLEVVPGQVSVSSLCQGVFF